MIDRSREETAAGIRFALDHPGFILRTRVKRVADYLSPTSFFIRHYALGKYEGVPAMDGVRRPLLVAAILLPLLVLAGSVPGFFRLLRRGDGWILALLPAALFLSAGLLVGASRFRMPVVPILILLASGALAGGGERLRRTDRAAVFLGWAALLFFWAVNAAEVRALLGRVW